MKYKHSPLKTMLNRGFELSSNWQFFHQECELLKEIFTHLHYPEPLVQNTFRSFVEMKVTGSTRCPQQADETPVRIPLPFKDQRSANKLREQLSDLSRKINTEVHPVFTSRKIKDELKPKEPKPPIVNQQNVVYFFVWCRLSQLYKPTLTSTCGGAQMIGNRQSCERTTWKRAMWNREEL